MGKSRSTNLIMGLAIIVLTICVYPLAAPGINSTTDAIIATTPGMTAFEIFLFNSAEYILLVAGFFIGILVIAKGGKD